MNQVPTRIANVLMNALKGGVVPRTGLEYITVGRTQEINAILHDIEMIEEGSASYFRQFAVIFKGNASNVRAFIERIIRYSRCCS